MYNIHLPIMLESERGQYIEKERKVGCYNLNTIEGAWGHIPPCIICYKNILYHGAGVKCKCSGGVEQGFYHKSDPTALIPGGGGGAGDANDWCITTIFHV